MRRVTSALDIENCIFVSYNLLYKISLAKYCRFSVHAVRYKIFRIHPYASVCRSEGPWSFTIVGLEHAEF